MDFPTHIDTISIRLPILYFKGSQIEFSKFLKVVLILVKSADPDEMQLYAAFHLGLRCLPTYLFPVYKGLKVTHHKKVQWTIFLHFLCTHKLYLH